MAVYPLPTISAGQSGEIEHTNQVYARYNEVVPASAFGVVANGSTDDGPALRAAAAEAVARDAPLVLPAGPIRLGSAVTDSLDSATVALPVEGAEVWIKGRGRGSGRSGSTGGHGSTELIIDVACDYGVRFRSGPGTPDWRGGAFSKCHVSDATGARVSEALVGVLGLNNFSIEHVSLSDARTTGAKALEILHATNGQPTQYGRAWNVDVWDCHNGIWLESNPTGTPVAPDWVIIGCQIQADSQTPPVSGGIGVYCNSNALHMTLTQIQNWETHVVIDQANGRGKHIDLDRVHFESISGASNGDYAACVEIRAGSSAIESLIHLAGCEVPQPAHYQGLIRTTGNASNIGGTRVSDWRIRDIDWLTSANAATYIDNAGTGTFDVDIDGAAVAI